MRSTPHIAVAPLFGWAFGVRKAKVPRPGVLWAIQQNAYYDVKLALDERLDDDGLHNKNPPTPWGASELGGGAAATEIRRRTQPSTGGASQAVVMAHY